MYNQGIGQEAQMHIQRKFNVVLTEVFVGPVKNVCGIKENIDLRNVKSKFLSSVSGPYVSVSCC